MGMRRLRRRSAPNGWTCRRGSSAVEFALVAPVLFLLFAGIAVFGICLGAAHNLRQIAAEAARASVAGVTDAERANLADRKSTRLNSSHSGESRMPSSA